MHGDLKNQSSDYIDRWKAERGRGKKKREIRKEKIREEKNQKKENADARKGTKFARYCVFPMICGSGGSKSRRAKGAGTELPGQIRDKKLHTAIL